MKKIYRLIGLLPFLGLPAAAASSDESDVMAVVHRLLGGFNRDRDGALSACADETSIIDSIAPMEWHGRGACAKWFEAYDDEVRTGGITDPVITLARPSHLDFAGETAYLVAAMTYSYKQHGAAKAEPKGTLTMSLKKSQSGWRITGMAWSDGVRADAPKS